MNDADETGNNNSSSMKSLSASFELLVKTLEWTPYTGGTHRFTSFTSSTEHNAIGDSSDANEENHHGQSIEETAANSLGEQNPTCPTGMPLLPSWIDIRLGKRVVTSFGPLQWDHHAGSGDDTSYRGHQLPSRATATVREARRMNFHYRNEEEIRELSSPEIELFMESKTNTEPSKWTRVASNKLYLPWRKRDTHKTSWKWVELADHDKIGVGCFRVLANIRQARTSQNTRDSLKRSNGDSGVEKLTITSRIMSSVCPENPLLNIEKPERHGHRHVNDPLAFEEENRPPYAPETQLPGTNSSGFPFNRETQSFCPPPIHYSCSKDMETSKTTKRRTTCGILDHTIGVQHRTYNGDTQNLQTTPSRDNDKRQKTTQPNGQAISRSLTESNSILPENNAHIQKNITNDLEVAVKAPVDSERNKKLTLETACCALNISTGRRHNVVTSSDAERVNVSQDTKTHRRIIQDRESINKGYAQTSTTAALESACLRGRCSFNEGDVLGEDKSFLRFYSCSYSRNEAGSRRYETRRIIQRNMETSMANSRPCKSNNQRKMSASNYWDTVVNKLRKRDPPSIIEERTVTHVNRSVSRSKVQVCNTPSQTKTSSNSNCNSLTLDQDLTKSSRPKPQVAVSQNQVLSPPLNSENVTAEEEAFNLSDVYADKSHSFGYGLPDYDLSSPLRDGHHVSSASITTAHITIGTLPCSTCVACTYTSSSPKDSYAVVMTTEPSGAECETSEKANYTEEADEEEKYISDTFESSISSEDSMDDSSLEKTPPPSEQNVQRRGNSPLCEQDTTKLKNGGNLEQQDTDETISSTGEEEISPELDSSDEADGYSKSFADSSSNETEATPSSAPTPKQSATVTDGSTTSVLSDALPPTPIARTKSRDAKTETGESDFISRWYELYKNLPDTSSSASATLSKSSSPTTKASITTDSVFASYNNSPTMTGVLTKNRAHRKPEAPPPDGSSNTACAKDKKSKTGAKLLQTLRQMQGKDSLRVNTTEDEDEDTNTSSKDLPDTLFAEHEVSNETSESQSTQTLTGTASRKDKASPAVVSHGKSWPATPFSAMTTFSVSSMSNDDDDDDDDNGHENGEKATTPREELQYSDSSSNISSSDSDKSPENAQRKPAISPRNKAHANRQQILMRNLESTIPESPKSTSTVGKDSITEGMTLIDKVRSSDYEHSPRPTDPLFKEDHSSASSASPSRY